jgi:mono/diheme cytochrome c family protein
MTSQPKYRPLGPSAFFPDDRSARPLVEGTVAQGWLEDDALDLPESAEASPVPLTPDLLTRGRKRYEIFCSVCHGLAGDGDGMIPRRGYTRPPSFHIDRLRTSPAGHFYDVISNGFGLMPDYAKQVRPQDRWAIVAYVRALQLSQSFPVAELASETRSALEAGTRSE